MTESPADHYRTGAASPWWTPLRLARERGVRLRLGPLTLYLHRGDDEWMFAAERLEAAEEIDARAELTPLDSLPGHLGNSRYIYRHPEGTVAFVPLLADRPVVIRPRQPVFMLPGEETTFYVSTPVWVGIRIGAETGGESATLLREVPAQIMSDTWFGPSTHEGVLCYAARTHARNHPDEVPLRFHRAVTPVRLHNRADSTLAVEKLSLPAPLLSIYGQHDGGLWTDAVHLARSADGDNVALRVEPGAPAGATLLHGPRQHPDRSALARALSELLG
jgi:hypothetical protein